MTGTDRRTKAELLLELGYATLGADQAREALAKRDEAHAAERAARDRETAALEGCITWLQTIEPAAPPVNMSSVSYTYGTSPGPKRSEAPSLDRALCYLRQRFGLPDQTAQIDDLMERLTQAENRANDAEQRLASVWQTIGGQP